jgi:hypothetical protein
VGAKFGFSVADAFRPQSRKSAPWPKTTRLSMLRPIVTENSIRGYSAGRRWTDGAGLDASECVDLGIRSVNRQSAAEAHPRSDDVPPRRCRAFGRRDLLRMVAQAASRTY